MFHRQADTVEEAGRLRVVGRVGHDAVESAPQRPALGTMLIEAGHVTSEQIKEAVKEGTETSERLGEVLLRQGSVAEADLAQVIATQWQFPFIPDDQVKPDPQAAFLISPDEGRRLGAIPFGFEAGQAIVAIADPTDERITAIHSLLGSSVKFVIVTQSAFARLISPESSERFSPQPVLRTATDGDAADVEPREADPQEVVPFPVAQDAGAPAEEVVDMEIAPDTTAALEDEAVQPVSSTPDPDEPVLAPVTAAVPPSEQTGDATSSQVDWLAADLEAAGRTLAGLPALVERAAGELRTGARRLAAAEDDLAESERKLAEMARTLEDTERKLAVAEQDLASERDARRLEQARVAELETEVANRDELLGAVRAKLSDLSGALGPSA
jgi:MshEN domain